MTRKLVVKGGNLDDSLSASPKSTSVVRAGAGNDYITVYSKYQNQIYGDAGSDTINASETTTFVDAGEGDDKIRVVALSKHRVFGGIGNDDIDFSFGNQFGKARLRGSVLIDSGDGDDTIRRRDNYEAPLKVKTIISAGNGNDRLIVDGHHFNDNVYYDLGDGDDVIRFSKVPEARTTRVIGGLGYDTIEFISDLIGGNGTTYKIREIRTIAPGSYSLAFQAYQQKGIGYEQTIDLYGFESIQYSGTSYQLSDIAANGNTIPWI